MSKRIVSPTLIPNRSWMPCSTDTSGVRRRAVPERAVDDPLVRLEVVAVGDGELAAPASRARRARPRSRLAASRLAARLHAASTRARSTGNQLELAARAVRRSARNARTPSTWPCWMSIRNMSGASLRHLNRELVEQARLQRPDADDEEGAEADGEQDDARLVARARQVQHGVAQRKRPRVRQRRDERDQRRPGQVQHERQAREPGADDQADAQRRRLPRRERDQRRGHERRSPPIPTQSRRAGAVSSRSSSDGLMSRTCSSGTTENSSDTSTPMPTPCTAALQVTP